MMAAGFLRTFGVKKAVWHLEIGEFEQGILKYLLDTYSDNASLHDLGKDQLSEIGKKIGAWIFPDDADLYEHYSGISGTLELLKDTAVTIGEEISYGLQDAWGAAKEAGQAFAEQTSEHFNNFKESCSTAISNVQEAAGTFVERQLFGQRIQRSKKLVLYISI